MSTVIATTQQPPALPPAPKKERCLEVRGKLRQAIMLMVYEGLPYNEAANKVDFTVAAMRSALERPHVIRFLREQKQVFRASVSAQNIHALQRLRDGSGNAMAQLGAIKVLEQLDDEQQPGAAAKSLPGLQIVIVQSGSQPPTIDVTPARSNTDD